MTPVPHVKRIMVYIAGPYSTDPVAGTHSAIAMAERLESTELFTPIVPHLNLLWDMIYPHPPQFWYDLDVALLDRVDALIRIPGDSPGADNEVIYAQAHHIPVFYRLSELVEWAVNGK